MDKLLLYDPEDKFGRHFFKPEEILAEKTADDYEWSPEIKDVVSKIQPDPKAVIVLLNAMGASEFYGSNSRGDAFREPELLDSYHTFERMGHVFKFHINKDPEKSIGSILHSVYNPRMHRVELIIKVDREKAPDIAQNIDDGKFNSVSMGSRVECDVCSICNQRNKTVADYCFTPGAMVKMGDFSMRPIESIAVGEEVITHLGRARKVTKVYKREYVGSVIRFSIVGDVMPFTATEDHPIIVIRNSGGHKVEEVLKAHQLDPKYVLKVPAIGDKDNMLKLFHAHESDMQDGYVTTEVNNMHICEYDGPVYNLEVEEDHTYTVSHVAVHNCDHLKNHMGEILDDGRQVFADNIKPKFFDISFVPVGADRTARVLRKVASGTISSAALAEAYKQMQKDASQPWQFSWSKIASHEKPIQVKDDITKEFAWDFVSSLAKLGIMPSIDEFAGIMKAAAIEPSDDMDADFFDRVELPKVAMMQPSRSAFSPYLENRVVDLLGDGDGIKISTGYKEVLVTRDPESYWVGISKDEPEHVKTAGAVDYAPMYAKYCEAALEYLDGKLGEAGTSYVYSKISPSLEKSAMAAHDAEGLDGFLEKVGEEVILSDCEKFKNDLIYKIITGKK